MEIVQRQVTLPVDTEEAWRLVSDPDELATWLGADVALDPVPGAAGEMTDDDGTRRQRSVDTVDHGRSISWYWWNDDRSDGVVSHVELQLTPDTHGTRLLVVERPVLPSASARATSFRAQAWSSRLFALEVRCLALATAMSTVR